MTRDLQPPVLCLIVPCFNEDENVLPTASRLKDTLDALIRESRVSPDSRILFVDDGSSDRTWDKLRRIAAPGSIYAAISLSRNFGHQNALLAGLMAARSFCQVSISLDADLQDDPSVIPGMLESFSQGNDIVYAVRRNRSSDSFPKRASAAFFYRLIRLLGVRLIPDAGDFRLMSRRAMDALALYPEHNPFLRGLVPLLGFSSGCVYFDRKPRQAGRSKYTFRRMGAFALDGLLSLSLFPLFLILPAGFILLAASVFLFSVDVSSPRLTAAAVFFAGAVVTCSLGILALYAAKIYTELLNRPRYIVKETLNFPVYSLDRM